MVVTLSGTTQQMEHAPPCLTILKPLLLTTVGMTVNVYPKDHEKKY